MIQSTKKQILYTIKVPRVDSLMLNTLEILHGTRDWGSNPEDFLHSMREVSIVKESIAETQEAPL